MHKDPTRANGGKTAHQRPSTRLSPAIPTPSPVLIGCSGWQYKHWRGDFYPPGLPQGRWLEHYAAQFDTVEVNNSFYRLPEAATFDDWRRRVPRRFVFAVKMSRYLTHLKKLKDPDEAVQRFFSRAERLRYALGPVLYQLPPRWPLGPVSFSRLEALARILPRRHRHAIEFRDPTWYAPEVFALLDRYRIALCLQDMQGSSTGPLSVGPFAYVRFHGTSKYSGRYSEEDLDRWAEWLVDRAQAGVPAYAYFNNDVGGHAPRDAVRLRTLVDTRLKAPTAVRSPIPG